MKSLLIFFVFASAHAQIIRAPRPAPYNPHQSSYRPPAPSSTPVRVRTSPSNWNEPPKPKSFVSTDPDEGHLIEIQMNDPAVGESMEVSELQGTYTGACYSKTNTTKEALYVGTYETVNGTSSQLLVSTLQLYGGQILPSEYRYLLEPTSENAQDFMREFIKNGYSGTDNNRGSIGQGLDFAYLYQSDISEKSVEVFMSRQQVCPNGICNPPLILSCLNDIVSGVRVFEGCVRLQDRSVFKRLEDGTLISYRTAPAVGTRANNYSFYLPVISTFCKWHRSLL